MMIHGRKYSEFLSNVFQVMYAQGLLFVVMMGKLFRKLFFGQLRAAEFEV